jgi:hypothetical protein
MGRVLEVITGRAVNPGATLTAVTPATGDSFTIRSAPEESGVFLADVGLAGGTDITCRIRSPRLHDNAQGIRLRHDALVGQMSPWVHGLLQRLYPQDTVTVELAGGAAETDVAALVVYYLDLPGSDARLATWSEIAPRVANIVGMEQAFSTSATPGDYGGEQAINADFDSFKRNVDYALFGYVSDAPVAFAYVRGPDTSNYRVPMLNLEGRANSSRDYLKRLSDATGLPCIPVINGANVGTTIVGAVAQTASVAVNLDLIVAELGH